MAWAIVDSGVYIGHWEYGLSVEVLDSITRPFVLRQSAVVLSELRRGAQSRMARRLVETLAKHAAIVWTPTVDDWWEAARLIQDIGDREGWDRSKRRSFQNDALIALTARRHGAAVITTNRADFDLLAGELGIAIVPVAGRALP
jgi:predicted nucleic acid-binding protein